MNIADVAQHVHALENKVKAQADEIERLRTMTKVNLEAFQNNVAEIERLREALKELLNVIPNFPPEGNFLVGMEERYNKALIEARSALQHQESK